jgi:transcriptional regulator with XRE-family HTH domain
MNRKVFSGRILASIRTFQKMKQEDLAALSGVSRPTINRIECGRTKYPTLETRQALADALDTPIEMFYKIEPHIPNNHECESSYCDEPTKSLTPEQANQTVTVKAERRWVDENLPEMIENLDEDHKIVMKYYDYLVRKTKIPSKLVKTIMDLSQFALDRYK